MIDNDIRDIIDALTEAIGLCITLEKAHVYEKKAVSAEVGLLHAKNMLNDLLNGKREVVA
jgi:hypothetical protein